MILKAISFRYNLKISYLVLIWVVLWSLELVENSTYFSGDRYKVCTANCFGNERLLFIPCFSSVKQMALAAPVMDGGEMMPSSGAPL